MDEEVKQEEETRTRKRVVFLGRRLQEGKLIYCYKDEGDILKGETSTDGASVFMKPITGKVIGGIYAVWQVRKEGKTAVERGRYEYVDRWKIEDDLDRWGLEDAAAVTQREMFLREKKDEGLRIKSMTIRDLAQKMATFPTTQRRAILATVIEILTRGRA